MEKNEVVSGNLKDSNELFGSVKVQNREDVDREIFFTYSIGGMCINIGGALLNIEIQACPSEYKRFFRSVNMSGADVHISMDKTSEPYEAVSGDVIFLNRHIKVQATEDGFQVYRFRDGQQETPYLIIRTDQYFSRFHYCFYSDVEQGLCYKLAADQFLLQHSFINHQGLLIHAGGGIVQGKGMIFSGTSGAGKSTLSELLCSSPKNQFFSDERLVIRFADERWNVWGTPWQSTGNIARNETAPLSALVFLKQGEMTKITELTPSQGLHRFLQVVSIPWYSEEWTNKGLAVCEPLVQEIPMFELTFRADESAVQAVEELASGLP
ncbi:MAG: hypothetical protein QTN59_17310 [Candidatus Electrothrix communis]|nr:MAG: hypothetical protein QTN59_17310 [Candidatus Electrothrix communis]